MIEKFRYWSFNVVNGNNYAEGNFYIGKSKKPKFEIFLVSKNVQRKKVQKKKNKSNRSIKNACCGRVRMEKIEK